MRRSRKTLGRGTQSGGIHQFDRQFPDHEPTITNRMSTLFGDLSDIKEAQRATDASLAALQRAIERCTSMTLPPIRITQEDRLRGAILEACQWLRDGAHGKALEVLESALRL